MNALTLLALAVLLTTELAIVPQAKAAEKSYKVGVIPSANSCPNGAQMLRITMDTDDTNNKNTTEGNKLAIRINQYGVGFIFCIVDGKKLFPLDRSSDKPYLQYAVLKAGTTCPNGSNEFWRYFDTEDKKNKNKADGPLGPNKVNKYGIQLFFCLFRGGNSTMKDFPAAFPGTNEFGYGVFAKNSFAQSGGSGFIYTDDEGNKGNKNQMGSLDSDYNNFKEDAERIIEGGQFGTKIYLAQVREVNP